MRCPQLYRILTFLEQMLISKQLAHTHTHIYIYIYSPVKVI